MKAVWRMEGWTEERGEGKGKRVICTAGLKYMAHTVTCHSRLWQKGHAPSGRWWRRRQELSLQMTHILTHINTSEHTHIVVPLPQTPCKWTQVKEAVGLNIHLTSGCVFCSVKGDRHGGHGCVSLSLSHAHVLITLTPQKLKVTAWERHCDL